MASTRKHKWIGAVALMLAACSTLVATGVLSDASGRSGAEPATGASASDASAVGKRSSIVGRSVNGRPIRSRRIGERRARRRALVVGSIHGDETQGHRVVRLLRKRFGSRLRGVDLWTVMTVNPDGVAANMRKNARSVDLNRNFSEDFDASIPQSSGYYSGPHPFSEPESRAVRDLVKRLRPAVTIWYHQPWGKTLIPCNRSRRVALRYARRSGLPPRDCYPSPPGAATGWQWARFGNPAFVVELPGRALTSAEVRRHARAVARVARPRG